MSQARTTAAQSEGAQQNLTQARLRRWMFNAPPNAVIPLPEATGLMVSALPKAPERIRAAWEHRGCPRVLPALVAEIAAELHLHEGTVERVLVNLPRPAAATAGPGPKEPILPAPPTVTETPALAVPGNLSPLQQDVWDELRRRGLDIAVRLSWTVATDVARAVNASGAPAIWGAQEGVCKKVGVELRKSMPSQAAAPTAVADEEAPEQEDRVPASASEPSKAEAELFALRALLAPKPTDPRNTLKAPGSEWHALSSADQLEWLRNQHFQEAGERVQLQQRLQDLLADNERLEAALKEADINHAEAIEAVENRLRVAAVSNEHLAEELQRLHAVTPVPVAHEPREHPVTVLELRPYHPLAEAFRGPAVPLDGAQQRRALLLAAECPVDAEPAEWGRILEAAARAAASVA